MRPNLREAVVLSTLLLPFGCLALLGWLGESPVALVVGSAFLAIAGAALVYNGFLAVRFGHVRPEFVPEKADIPRKILLGRAAIYLVALPLIFRFGTMNGDDSFSTSRLAFGAYSLLVLTTANLCWRRWTRSYGLDPDGVLLALSKS